VREGSEYWIEKMLESQLNARIDSRGYAPGVLQPSRQTAGSRTASDRTPISKEFWMVSIQVRLPTPTPS
jgi:hypothetical protein